MPPAFPAPRRRWVSWEHGLPRGHRRHLPAGEAGRAAHPAGRRAAVHRACRPPVRSRPAHRMALASPRVRSTSVEAQEFPDLARRYQVSAVPKIVLNDRVEFMGAAPEPMFLEAVLAAVSEEDETDATEIDAGQG